MSSLNLCEMIFYMQTLTEQQLQQLKKTLLSELQSVKEKVKARLRISSKAHLNELVDKVDEMSADSLIENLVHAESHSLNLYKARIKSIDAALQGMELGLYGLCSDCETELDAQQLIDMPTAQRCPVCEKKFQQQKVKTFQL